ncbi:DUF3592 domain-containing protein [Pseudomonas sp. P9_2]|uniref:DUF3592 domain-containing protein n=1 Tax=Pseudomonas sp. P9_2 TaxID=3043447 RepID=UPI002A36BC21|nr:DUF3592 domain-containing protein [Pseudomonas sp. P9_2]WPN51990.1 DUF3592 domain-containing protein [Pseudomonas sp. P9_2]
MKMLSVIKYLFSIVGVVLLVGAIFAYKSSSEFLTVAVPAQGTIIDLIKNTSGDSVSYHPVVRFITNDGQTVEFKSSTGGHASSYPVGETIEVLYTPHNPEDATIKSFFAVWGAVLVTTVLGAGFVFIGVILFLVGFLKNRKKDYLQKNGIAVEARIQSVEVNYSLTMNQENPFVIICQWLNPETSELHMFQSENIWFDPLPYMEREVIKVLIEKNNPKKYYVDISFLPKLAR